MSKFEKISILVIVLVISIAGRWTYLETKKWSIQGEGPITEIRGDDTGIQIIIREQSSFEQVLNYDLFHGFHPAMVEGEYPGNRKPDGQIIEDNVDYLVFGVHGGRILQHSYAEYNDGHMYRTDILEFRPSVMHLEEMFNYDVLRFIPKYGTHEWILIKKEKEEEGSRFHVEMESGFVEIEGRLVKKLIWEINY